MDDNSRIARLEETTKSHADKLKEHDVDIARNREDLDKMHNEFTEFKTSMKIIELTTSNIDSNVKEMKLDSKDNFKKIDEKYTELRKIRDEDHLIKPMDKANIRNEKVWDKVVGGLIGFGLTALIGVLTKLL